MADTPIATGAGLLGLTGYAMGAVTYSLTSAGKRNGYRTRGSLLLQGIKQGPCRVYGVYPEPATMAGTLTLYNSPNGVVNNFVHVCAAALTQNGKGFGGGIDFPDGLVIQQSSAADNALIIWEAL